jgi:predicted  nucleic acid-binding Zn-ribbon protein
MKPTSIDLFQTLKTKMGEREANAPINYIEKKLQDGNHELFQLCLNTFATKLELKEEIAKVREDLSRLETKITSVEGRLETKIVEVNSDVIRWMFGFFVAMLIAILGLYLRK